MDILNFLLHSCSNVNDVTIHCKDGKKVQTNKFVLSKASKTMLDIFSNYVSCDCANVVGINFDLVCPDFMAEAMDAIIQLLVTGMVQVR